MPKCLVNEQTKPHRPRGGARLPMLTICRAAGYSTCVLPVNMPVAFGIGGLMALTKSKKHYVGLKWATGETKGGFAMQCDKTTIAV